MNFLYLLVLSQRELETRRADIVALEKETDKLKVSCMDSSISSVHEMLSLMCFSYHMAGNIGTPNM